MFLEILFFLFGISIGVATGLIPGLHPNTIFAALVSFPFLLVYPFHLVLIFVVSLSITNTFLDFIPSIFFGAPDPSGALSVLPGHRLLMEGKGYEALYLTVIGGLGATLLTAISFPLLLIFIPFLYSLIVPYIHILLILVVAFMIFLEKRLFALGAFLLAGFFGLLTLNSFPSGIVIFPALTGLFGLSGLVESFLSNTEMPKQTITKPTVSKKGIITGWFAGLLSGILPGIGSAQAGIISNSILKSKTRDFLTSLGGVNTANIIFTFISLLTLGKTRSGAAWLMSQIHEITLIDLINITTVAVISCLVAVLVTLKLGKFIVKRLDKINYKKVNVVVISILFILIYIFTGFLGLLIGFVGMFIGLLTILSGVNRSHLMGFLLLPTILYFSGFNPVIFGFLF